MPQLRQVSEKLDGCDMMKCGQNWHGGDVQNGCGKGFSWKNVKPYKRNIDDHPAHRKVRKTGADLWLTIGLAVAAEPEQGDLLAEWLLPTGGPVQCDACRLPVRGPRFACLHCRESFDVCHMCVGDFTKLVPRETAAGCARKGRLHLVTHVFNIKWNSAAESLHAGAALKQPALVSRVESRIREHRSPFIASAAWCGPLRDYAYYRGERGLGYYKQAPSREETVRQQASALLHEIDAEMESQGGARLQDEAERLADKGGKIELSHLSRCLFRFGLDLTNEERETLRRALDPRRAGRVLVGDIEELLRSAEEVAAVGAQLLGEVFAFGSIVGLAGLAPFAPEREHPRVVRTHSSSLRAGARRAAQCRRQTGEETFVCLGGTPLLKLRNQGWKLADAARRPAIGEERVVRLVPGSATQPPALSWERPWRPPDMQPQPAAHRTSMPRRFCASAAFRLEKQFTWKTKVLPLDVITALVYAPTRLASAAPAVLSAPSIDRARLFCLWTSNGRGFDFMARSISDCRAWVLTLGRILRARGVYARVRTRRAFVRQLVRARIEKQAEAYRMSVGEVWMIALRRAAEALGRPFQEYQGHAGVCICCPATQSGGDSLRR